VIGILGGIGSGKSSVVKHVVNWDLLIIDADKIGHEQLTVPTIQTALRNTFGDQIFSDSQTIGRAQLAARVFGPTDEHQEAREKLNSILHPAIRQQITQQISSAPPAVHAIILDAALLLEGGWDTTCHWLIFVDTPQEIRVQRVQETRGWTADGLARREDSQGSVSRKKDRADFIVDNSGSRENAARQMEQVFSSVIEQKC